MALEAIVYPNDLFNYGCKDLPYSLSGGWRYEGSDDKCPVDQKHHHQQLVNLYSSSSSSAAQNLKHFNPNSSPEEEEAWNNSPVIAAETANSRRKRRRTKSSKNKEDVENQRMTHIFVERNRRKQMNEYLSRLRSLMPASYVQRSDQASIVGGAINFLKELEQLLQTLEAQTAPPFANLFSQYFSAYSTQYSNNSAIMNESVGENRSGVANIEVTKVESHANLKILSRRRPKQLLKMVVEFQKLRLTILHLSVTTVDQMVLYTFSIKVEDECQLTSVDEISNAVYQMLDRINDEAASSD